MKLDKDSLVEGYTKAGYVLTPLNGKIPIKKDWVKTEYNANTKGADFSGNYGVVLQDDDLIVDVDPRHFPEGDNVLLRLANDYNLRLTDTFIVRTGGNGLHIYYKKPVSVAIRGALKDYPGIEFKTKGQQVVGAGSKHPETGAMYEVLRKAFMPTSAPESLLNAVKRQDIIVSADNNKNVSSLLDGEQNIQRFISYLKTAPKAVEGEGGDVLTFKTACRGRDYALSENKTYELMASYWNNECEPPWELEDLQKKVHNAYSYNNDSVGKRTAENDFADFRGVDEDIVGEEQERIIWDVTDKGVPKKTLRNVVNYLLCKDYPFLGTIKLNDFTNDITFVHPAPWHNGRKVTTWTDEDCINLKYWLNANKAFVVPTLICQEAAVVAASKFRYHPVRDWLTSLEWDGVKRLDTWLTDYAQVEDNEYTRAVGAKTLMGAVARVIHPGVKFDTMLVLEGGQGIGKSTLVSILGGEWYDDVSITDSDKDTVDAMRGSWIIEVSEMVCSKKVETDKLKSFLSKTTDRVRLAYRRNAQDFPRQSIFIGTTNPGAGNMYLKDETGNRRFWPVLCRGDIDTEGIKKVRAQLFAEAYSRYIKGEKLYIDKKEVIDMANKETEKRTEDDPWTDTIRRWLARPDIETGKPKDVVLGTDILEQAVGVPVSKATRAHLSRISFIMTHVLGWEKGKFYIKSEGRTANAYRLPENVMALESLGLA